jgi:iron complex outermembrane receptor protein
VVQDEWTPVSDWTFTLGVRFDDYSDFGSTTNPRAAVVWSPTARTSVKLLYGTAFRPPSIIELQSNGIASALGNPNLNPVRLAMSELSLVHRSTSYSASVGAFQYRQEDLVQTVPDINSPTGLLYVNRDSDQGWGAETSVELRATPRLTFEANYTYQTHTGSTSDNANAQQAPRHQISLNIDGTLWRDWHVNTFVLGILGRHRATLDPRPNPPDYALVNLALERANFFSGLDASFALHNILDRRIDDPSDSAAVLPDDIPVPGRTWFVELRKRF